VTLDDTPGTGEYDRAGQNWKAPSPGANGRSDGPYRKFHLEFNLHGGDSRTGFGDGDSAGLLKAMEGIEAFCIEHGGETTINDEDKGRLIVVYPKSAPEKANMQLTAGASLVGLQAALAGNKRLFGRPGAGGPDGTVEPNPMLFLAVESRRQRLAEDYVPPEDIARQIPRAAKFANVEDPKLNDVALKSLSTMFTMIKTFLKHQAAATREGNIKEATPLLWKTPLNLFFDSADLGPYRDRITPLWGDLMEIMFDELRDPIHHPPDTDEPIQPLDWLMDLPERDLLYEIDEDYDESFGGLGALEGGATSADQAQRGQGSFGQPIIEFRALPSKWTDFKAALEDAVKSLTAINKRATPSDTASTGAASSEPAYALSQ